MAKLKITPGMLERRGEVERLEGNGHNLESITNAMYKLTDGATTKERRDIMTEFYKRDRSKGIIGGNR
jgi:hypothetical protein